MEEPSPEFMAASEVAQIAPLLFNIAEQVEQIGDAPEHVAVAQETVDAHLQQQNLDIDRTVATVERVENGVEIEYKGRTVTITFDGAS